jgi:hypothetical protein
MPSFTFYSKLMSEYVTIEMKEHESLALFHKSLFTTYFGKHKDLPLLLEQCTLQANATHQEADFLTWDQVEHLNAFCLGSRSLATKWKKFMASDWITIKDRGCSGVMLRQYKLRDANLAVKGLADKCIQGRQAFVVIESLAVDLELIRTMHLDESPEASNMVRALHGDMARTLQSIAKSIVQRRH